MKSYHEVQLKSLSPEDFPKTLPLSVSMIPNPNAHLQDIKHSITPESAAEYSMLEFMTSTSKFSAIMV